MIGNVQPDLKDIADGQPIRIHRCTKHGLRDRRYADEDVDRLAGASRYQPERFERNRVETLQVQMGGDAANESESEGVRRRKQGQTHTGTRGRRGLCAATAQSPSS